MTRHTHSLDEIKDKLLDQLDSVVHYFAPEAPGAYTERGKYFTLNPGRADRRVGSFVIRMTGADAGRWNDYATGSRGDVLDLCGLAVNGDGKTDIAVALREARAFLGLATQDPAAQRAREDRAEESRQLRRQQEAQERDQRERRRAAAHRLWLSGASAIGHTPVGDYLAARGVDLARLPRQPNVLRYLPACKYQHMDRDTGEVIEAEYPAMGAAVTSVDGKFQGIHRTYLHHAQGTWAKAPVPAAKKVLGNAWGHGINVWAGQTAEGKKPPSLPQCPPGTHVYLTEGIEDALSVALLLPAVRVVAAISLGNLAAIRLPAAVARVTIVADRDEAPEPQRLLARAVDAHRSAGREVRLWMPPEGCKDINDVLRDMQPEHEMQPEDE